MGDTGNSRIQPSEGEGEVPDSTTGEPGSDEQVEGGLADLLPWRARTPQDKGREAEKRLVKQRGGRVHPRSGAGRIKNDGSTREADFEVKHTARSSFTLKGEELKKSWVQAVRSGKEQMMWVIEFEKHGIVAEIIVKPKGVIMDG